MKILGSVGVVRASDDHPYIVNHRVRVVAVLVDAANPEVDADDVRILKTVEEVEALERQLGAGDRLEVQPWLETESRFSVVTSDVRFEEVQFEIEEK